MKNINAVFRKELKGFLYSPIAYVIGVLLIGLAGFFFYLGSIEGGFAGIQPMLVNLAVFILFAAPLMTMKVVAEEKKKGTIELLLTLPLKPADIILGKFFAVSVVFLLILAVTLIHTLVLILLGNPEIGVIFTLYLGVILEGLALIALGVFMSTLTDSQVIAGIASLGLGLLLLLVNLLAEGLPSPWSGLVGEFSFIKHLNPFFRGMIDLKDAVFFILVIVFGLSFSTYYLSQEKWRK